MQLNMKMNQSVEDLRYSSSCIHTVSLSEAGPRNTTNNVKTEQNNKKVGEENTKYNTHRGWKYDNHENNSQG